MVHLWKFTETVYLWNMVIFHTAMLNHQRLPDYWESLLGSPGRIINDVSNKTSPCKVCANICYHQPYIPVKADMLYIIYIYIYKYIFIYRDNIIYMYIYICGTSRASWQPPCLLFHGRSLQEEFSSSLAAQENLFTFFQGLPLRRAMEHKQKS